MSKSIIAEIAIRIPFEIYFETGESFKSGDSSKPGAKMFQTAEARVYTPSRGGEGKLLSHFEVFSDSTPGEKRELIIRELISDFELHTGSKPASGDVSAIADRIILELQKMQPELSAEPITD